MFEPFFNPRGVAVIGEDFSRNALQPLPGGGFGGQDIVHASHGLHNFTHFAMAVSAATRRGRH